MTARESNPVSFKNLSYYAATSVKKVGVICVIYTGLHQFFLAPGKGIILTASSQAKPPCTFLDSFSSLNAFVVDLRTMGQRMH